MPAVDLAVTRLQKEEGFRPSLYLDTTGHQTIGYGFNVQAGMTQTQALALLNAQVLELDDALSRYWWWTSLDAVRASVILDLAFNLGLNGLLHFPNMLSAIGVQDWITAHDELLDSDAARLLPARYGALAETLLNGV